MSSMIGGTTARRVAGLAVAGATGGAASECRARAPTELTVSDGSSSWILLPGEVEAAKALVMAENVDLVASKALDMAQKMAASPAVQRAVLEELGGGMLLDREQPAKEDLEGWLSRLQSENAALIAENAATKEALSHRVAEAAKAQKVLEQLRTQNELLSDENFVIDNAIDDTESLDDVEEAAEEAPKPPPADINLLEKVLAVAGILVMLALTKKISPAFLKKAAVLSAATVSSILASMKR